MRRIQLDGNDASLFAHDLDDADLNFYHGHKDTFKRMWQEQGKKFWIRFVITYRWHITNHGDLTEFPGKREDFDAIIDQAFIYIHENFVDAKLSQAHGLLLDMFMLSLNKGQIKYLETKPRSKDPFFHSSTRDVFRRLFGDPSDKISYVNVYFTLPLYGYFGGSLIQCLRRWLDAPELAINDETYWEPPQKLSPPSPPSPGKEKPVKKASLKKKTKKKKATSIPATNDGHTVDNDYVIYLEEKLKGHRFGPLWLPRWEFGDPRFVDEMNPLYDLSADRTSDWRQDLDFEKFRKFYNYLKTSSRFGENCSVFLLYHPDIIVYPPPKNRRIYDEIERSFLQRCERHYHLGVTVPKEKLPVDDYYVKDVYHISRRETNMVLTSLQKDLAQYPSPNIMPRLPPGACLFIIRKHIDGQGLYDSLLPNSRNDKHEITAITSELSGENREKECPYEREQRERSSKLLEDLRKDFKDTDPTPARRIRKKPKKPKSAQQKLSDEESTENPSDPVNRTGGAKKKVREPQGAVGGKKSAAKLAEEEETEDSLEDMSDDERWYLRRTIKPKGPNYPTCLEEMNVVSMEDIEPQVVGLLQLTAADMGGQKLFELARRKATLPLPDCRDEFTYGDVTDYTARQLIDTMAVTIALERRKARRGRRRAAERQAELSRQLEVKKDLLKRLANSPDCKKVSREAEPVRAADGSLLHKCIMCKEVEPSPRTFKKCQRCKVENVKTPRYYCSRECQALDWKERHRTEHNEHLLPTNTAS